MSVCRNRPMACPECGYRCYGTRSWWLKGLPCCPCGAIIQPTKPSDLAYCGIIGPEDCSQAAWNAICRENGWNIVRNAGQASRASQRGTIPEPVLGRRRGADHCVFPGCGRWIADRADCCTAGHAQYEHAVLEATPF